MKYLKAFVRYWYDFVVGDDWKIAAAVMIALVLFFVILKNSLVSGTWLVVIGAALIMLAFCVSLFIDSRSKFNSK